MFLSFLAFENVARLLFYYNNNYVCLFAVQLSLFTFDYFTCTLSDGNVAILILKYIRKELKESDEIIIVCAARAVVSN